MKKGSVTREIAAIVAIAAVVALTFNLLSPAGIPLVRTEPVKIAVADSAIFGRNAGPAAPFAAAAAETSGQAVFRVITLGQMRRVVDERPGMILDARTPDEFAKGRIPGAVNLYAMEPEAWVGRVGDLPRDTLMVLYCSNPHCPFGRTLAEYLGAFGFTNMLLFDDGWDAWTEAGLPSEGGGEGGR
jgi:rhodanese-related sulfurtransferase